MVENGSCTNCDTKTMVVQVVGELVLCRTCVEEALDELDRQCVVWDKHTEIGGEA